MFKICLLQAWSVLRLIFDTEDFAQNLVNEIAYNSLNL